MPRPLIALFAAAGALLAAPAASQAAVDTIGSSLAASADVPIQNTEDTGLAQLTGTGGGQPRVINSGQATVVKVKGCVEHGAVPQDPETALFVQDLKPQGNGSTVVVSTSQRFNLPICDRGADNSTVSAFHPTDQCVTRGDLIGVVVGGQTPGYPSGSRSFIATNSPDGVLGSRSANGGFSDGAKFTFTGVPGRELLLQATIGSGSDSPSRCAAGPGGGSGGGPGSGAPTRSSVSLPSGATANAKSGAGTLSAGCTLPAGDTCKVSLVFFSGSGRKAKRAGSVVGSIRGGATGDLALRLNRTGKRKLRGAGRVSGALRGSVSGKAGKAKVSGTLTVTT